MYILDRLEKLPKMVLLFAFLFLFSCSEEEDPAALASAPSMPVVSEVTTESITVYDVDLTSKVKLSGTAMAQDYGFVYAEIHINALSEGTKVSLGSLTETKEFSYTLSELKKSQQYFVRAYAVSDAGTTILGTEKTFTTYGLNTWFPVDVSGVPTDQNLKFMGLQLSMEGKGYIGFGVDVVNGTDVIPLYEYNPTTLSMTKMPNCPAEYYRYTQRFALNKNIYVIAKNKVWKFDTSSKQWKALSDIESTLDPRFAFTVNQEAWLMATNTQTMKPELWVYNEANDSWALRSVVSVETLITEVYGVIVLNSKLYIVTAIVGKAAKLHEYDIAQNKYTSLNAPPVEIPEGSVTDTYAISTTQQGYFVNTSARKIWRYNPTGDTWISISPPASTSGIALFPLNEDIYSVSYGVYRYVPE